MFFRKKQQQVFPPPIFGPGALHHWQENWDAMAMKLQKRLNINWNPNVFSAILSVLFMASSVVSIYLLPITQGTLHWALLAISAPVLPIAGWTWLAWLFG